MSAANVRRLAITGAAALSLGATTATAAAEDLGNNALEAGAAAYQAAYPKLSAAQAKTAAAGSDARRVVYDAVAQDTSTFGGAWFDPVTGIVHINATTDAALKQAATAAQRYGVAVKTARVGRSVAQLEALAGQLRKGQGEVGDAADGQVGIDVKTNEVVAAVPASRRPALVGKAPGGVKLVDESKRRVEADAGCTSRSACDWTLRAGSIMWRSNSTIPWCSIGFTARNSSNTRFVYTAGHCTTGNGIGWGTGAQPIGPMNSSLDSGAIDASIIQVTNSWFTGDLGGEIYIENGASRTVPVKGVAPTLSYIVAGETVCLSANFTSPSGGNYCGVVGTNSDASVRGMVRVDGVDACGGDSGGGWYWLPSSGNRYAYGIHSRSDAGCHGDASGTRSWFTAVPTAKNGFAPTLNIETR